MHSLCFEIYRRRNKEGQQILPAESIKTKRIHNRQNDAI